LEGLGIENFGVFHGHLVYFDRNFGIFYGSLLFWYIHFFPFWFVAPRKLWQPWTQGIFNQLFSAFQLMGTIFLGRP
jgi:hypothetical protein